MAASIIIEEFEHCLPDGVTPVLNSLVASLSSVSPSQNLVLSLNSNSVLLSISLLSSWTYFVPLYFAPLYVSVTPVNGILFIASFGTIA